MEELVGRSKSHNSYFWWQEQRMWKRVIVRIRDFGFYVILVSPVFRTATPNGIGLQMNYSKEENCEYVLLSWFISVVHLSKRNGMDIW